MRMLTVDVQLGRVVITASDPELLRTLQPGEWVAEEIDSVVIITAPVAHDRTVHFGDAEPGELEPQG